MRVVVILVRRYLKIKRLLRLLDRVTVSDTKSGKIVIGNIRNNLFYIVLDYTLAYIFSKMGYSVFILIDDGQLPHHDNRRILNISHNSPPTKDRPRKMLLVPDKIHSIYQRLFTAALRKYLMQFLPVFSIDTKWIKSNKARIVLLLYSEILKVRPINADLLESRYLQMNSGSISKNVNASHRRHFGGRDFNPNDSRHIEYAKLSIKNEIISELVADYLLKEIQPSLYITLDGIYTTFGSIVDSLRAHNIPTLVYQPNGFRDRSIYIGENHFSINNVSSHWNVFIKDGYTAKVRQEAEAFMRNRLKLESYVMSSIDKEWLTLIEEEKRRYKKTVCMFPNLTWDGAIIERDIVFNGLGAWLKESVEWIVDKNILLVIREHPQPEYVYNNMESSLTLVRELIPDIDKYENVILIKGTESVNSYQLIRAVADCSIVYNGTLGVEIPCMGEPVIIAANSPYSHKGVGYEPNSKEEYFNYIMTVYRDSNDFLRKKNEIRENAFQAAAYQFVYNAYYCPLMPTLESFHSRNRYWQDWDLYLEHLDPRVNMEWDRTIKRFLEPISTSRLEL